MSPGAQLLAEMERHGLLPSSIIWDGEPHRFPGKGQKRGSSGWYVAFSDRRGAVYGDWREPDVKHHWQAESDEKLTGEKRHAAHQAARAQFEEERKRREEKQKEKQAAAAHECEQIWKGATQSGVRDFPYVARKQLPKAPGARLAKKNGAEFLVVPVFDPESNTLVSLLWIAADGSKKYHPGGRTKGCCFEVGASAFETDKTLYICEGWATAVSVHLTTKCAVVIAFSAGNLKRVTVHFRKKYPEATINVCADNDRYSANGKGKHNPGVTAARAAVKAAREAVPGAKTDIAIPDFESLDGKSTDFDDLRQREGLDAVRRWLNPKLAEKADTRAPLPTGKLHLNGSTAEDLRQAFEHFGIEVQFDLRGQAPQFRLSHPLGDYPLATWITPEDRLEAALQELITTKCVNTKTRKAPGFIRGWQRRVNAIVAERQVDPFEEFLNSIPEWDGKETAPPPAERSFRS